MAERVMKPLVSLDAIRAAAARIRGVARVTPLVEVAPPSVTGATDGPRLFLKCENLQLTGAFKIRGAFNMIAQLAPDDRARGVITYSSGNHGLAVSFAARRLGIPAVVVMPTTAPPVKVNGARGLGAEVLIEGTTIVHRRARAESEAARRGLTIVPPFDHEWIVAGQGTIGLEIVDACPEVTTVYVQVGGGGLISGIAAAIKRLKPAVRIVGVEPAGAPKMSTSLRAGHPVTLDRVETIADGLTTVRPGDVTFPHVQAFVDEIVQADDAATIDAVRWLFREARLVVEPSGAVAVAAALARGVTGTTVAVLSGGNVEPAAYAKYLAG
jgi:threo-3-hydroxy-L-aspartate ammonia-lyase